MITQRFLAFLFGCIVFIVSLPVEANYFRHRESDIDPDVFRIVEKDYMGVKLDPKLELIDQHGKEFKFGDLAGKPTILVWSYYTCDGSCSAVNAELKSLLEEVKTQKIGEHYQILTLSFDKDDNLESLKEFRTYLELPPEWEQSWTFAFIKDPSRVVTETKKTGFNFFWAPQDKTFYHPNVFIMLSADGRITRYIYALTNNEKDMGLALLEARQGNFKMNETLDFVIGLCYSYNYAEGRYTYNIPLFVGLGALFIGISMLLGSVLLFRKKNFKEGT
ncbi:MAG: SCO family protein [Magnetococcales bacterium]|nr:SCO family protein [Magnetococcales bacterium]